MKNATDKVKAFSVLLTELSKAFDCLSHDCQLTIAKLNAYGVNLLAVKLKYSQLCNRKHCTKVNHEYS